MMRRAVIAALVLPAGLLLLLGAEVLLAIAARRLPERAPFELSDPMGASDSLLRMVWIGDSVSAGVGATEPDAALPRLVAGGLESPIELRVFAVSGARVGAALRDQAPRLEALRPGPDVVVVEVGANDVTHLTSRGGFARDYERLLARVVGTNPKHVIVLGMPAFGTAPRFLQPLRWIVGWRSRRLDAVVRRAAATHRARYVDIAGATGSAFGKHPERYYAADGFHPSDAGYELWARAVLESLPASITGLPAAP